MLNSAFPGSFGALALRLHSAVESGLIKVDALIPGRVLHKVERHAESVIKLERIFSRVGLYSPTIVAGCLNQWPQIVFQPPEPEIQRVREASFFGLHRL